MAKATPVPANPIPQTEEEAAYHAQEYVKEAAAVDKLDAQEKAEVAAVKEKFADRKKPHIEARDEHLKQAQAWGEAHRRGRKTIKLPNGRELQWRLPSSSSLLFEEENLETIVRSLMRLKNFKKYVSFELRKNNIKADLGELHKLSRTLRRFLRLDKTEYFRIS